MLCFAQTVLGCIENLLARLEEASRLGYSQSRCELASGGIRFVLDMVSSVRQKAGRKRVSKQLRALIFRMVAENPTWGAPRIHGELLKLGFDVSERSVSRCLREAPRDPHPVKRWLTFLRNHREAIAAIDFFTVPTLTDRTHLGLAKDAPAGRSIEIRSKAESKIQSLSQTRWAAPSLCGGSVDSRAIPEDNLLFLSPGGDTLHMFCELLLPNQPAETKEPKSLR